MTSMATTTLARSFAEYARDVTARAADWRQEGGEHAEAGATALEDMLEEMAEDLRPEDPTPQWALALFYGPFDMEGVQG